MANVLYEQVHRGQSLLTIGSFSPGGLIENLTPGDVVEIGVELQGGVSGLTGDWEIGFKIDGTPMSNTLTVNASTTYVVDKTIADAITKGAKVEIYVVTAGGGSGSVPAPIAWWFYVRPTAKTTPVDADTIGITDSADSSEPKRLSWANLKATLKTYLDTLYVALAGNQTIAGIKTFSSSPIVPTPSGATDAANKGYVDASVAGFSWKQSVRAATTANGTLATAYENGDTVDGVVLATGDRILIKNQSSGAENGIYVVQASGAPVRATDADSAAEILQASVAVQEGTTNADTNWTCTTNAPITLGSTSLTFAQFAGGGGGGVSDGDKGDITVSSSGSVWTADADAVVKMTGPQTVAGVKTFSSSPVVPTPSGSTDAANKSYVDNAIAGLSWKLSVRAATTVAGTLASSFENGDTIDGVVLATGDRILIKNQASGAENGIYTVNASGAPTRAADADTGAEMLQASVYVQEGTTNADTQWVCTTNATITLGSTSLTFAQLTSGGGSGTVTHTGGALTANRIVLGAGTDDTKVAAGLRTNGTSEITVGEAGVSVGAINLENGTSGSIKISPVTGALGSVTLTVPAITDTLVTRNTVDTFTNKKNTLPADHGTDDTYFGTIITGLSNSGGVTQWDVVYLNSSSQWVLADANGSGTYPARGMAVATTATSNQTIILVNGTVRNDGWSWTPGSPIYLSTTVGGLTQTAPSASGDKVQVVGFALTATIAYFDFNSTYLTVT